MIELQSIKGKKRFFELFSHPVKGAYRHHFYGGTGIDEKK